MKADIYPGYNCFLLANRTMDLSLRDALGGGGVPSGAPAEALLKRDFVATLEKEAYDDKVGETVSKSDYRPLLDGKDTKSGESLQKHTESALVPNVMLTPEAEVVHRCSAFFSLNFSCIF